MCILCSINRPLDPLVGLDKHETGSGFGSVMDIESFSSDSLLPQPISLDLTSGSDGLLGGGEGAGGGAGDPPSAPYTFDQIAGQLTDGFWAWSGYAGSTWRAWDIGVEREITYNVSGLSATEQQIAEAALDIMGRAAGITFVEVGVAPPPTIFTEVTDVLESTASTFTITTNSETSGSIGSSTDEDWYRINLVAGQTYTIELNNTGSLDPYLSLRDSSGGLITFNDDGGPGTDSLITYTAATTGTYFIEADAYQTSTGSYLLRVAQSGGGGAQIIFDNNDGSGAYSEMTTSGNEILTSNINIPSDWSPLNLNGYMLQTYIHELGHSLGLGHSGNYNGNATFGTDNLFDNDSWSTSIMSYFDMTTNTFDPATQQNLSTMMPADVIALQNLYGTNNSANTGSTQWGRNANMGGYLQTQINNWINGMFDGFYYNGTDFAYTIVDNGGNDLLDFSNFSMDQQLTLAELGYSDIGGQIDNIAIARGSVIERGTTGAGDDVLIGNGARNTLTGNGGNDTMYGGNGADTLNGGSGNDLLRGENSDDALFGNTGDDTLMGGANADAMDGGTGFDAASYTTATVGLRADLRNVVGYNTGEAAGDFYTSVEDLLGSAFGDTLIGNNSVNELLGYGGNDVLYGQGGNDFIGGGGGNDRLYGGNGNDTLTGNSGADSFALHSGTDRVTDFADNVDEIWIEDTLLAAGNRTVAGVINTASVVGGNILLTFSATNVLIIEGFTNIAALSDDIVLI